MPFTLSHTFVILPFKKRLNKYFSLSGLLMGCMVPDFEFFIRVTLYGIWGHTWLGLFLFDLPVALILLLIFHEYIKIPLINNLPNFLKLRFLKYKTLNWLHYLKNHFAKVVISILIGIITHFIWDNFTHEPNYISSFYIQGLTKEFNLFGATVPLYMILQILSSIIGLIGFVYFTFKAPISQKPHNQTNTNILPYWLKTLILCIILIIIRYKLGVYSEKKISEFLVICIGSFLYSLTIISITYKPKKT